MRGMTIRTFWRFRYLPVFSFAYWEHFASWWNFAMVSVAFGDLFIYGPVVQHKEIPVLFQFSALVAYATALKYLTIRRSDRDASLVADTGGPPGCGADRSSPGFRSTSPMSPASLSRR